MENQTNSPYFGDILLEWSAPEHDTFELGPKARIVLTILLILIIAWALYTNSPMMAITFILVGVVGYLMHIAEPKQYRFALTDRGVLAHNEFYAYDTIRSFFIHTDPPLENLLSIRTTGILTPHVHIPLADLDHEAIRRFLSAQLTEETHDPSMVDILERLLHI